MWPQNKYELACEKKSSNFILEQGKVKYYFEAIEYSNFIIKVADADNQKDGRFFIPLRSLIEYRFNNKNYYPSTES